MNQQQLLMLTLALSTIFFIIAVLALISLIKMKKKFRNAYKFKNINAADILTANGRVYDSCCN